MSISIRISEKNYEKLQEISGMLQAINKKSASVNDAVTHILENKETDIMKLAGSMSNKTASMIRKDIEEFRKSW